MAKKKATKKKATKKKATKKKATKKKATKKKATKKKATKKKATKKKATKKKATKKKATKKKATKKKAVEKKPTAAEQKQYERLFTAVEYLDYIVRNPEAAYLRACQALADNRDRIMKIGGVVGAEVAVKMVAQRSVRIFAIRILVKNKCRPAEFKTMKTEAIPSHFDGIPTDVVEICEFAEASDLPGEKINTSKPGIGPGTLGAQVRLSPLASAPGEKRYLTCAHVVSNNASSGTVNITDSTNARIAHITPSQSTAWEKTPQIDCALVTPTNPPSTITPASNGSHAAVNIGSATSTDMQQDGIVWKIGQNTGLTYGTLISMKSDQRPLQGGGFAIGQIVISPRDGSSEFAQGGDSGAIVAIGNKAIGILRAVSVGPTSTGRQEVLATPLNIISDTLSSSQLDRFGLL